MGIGTMQERSLHAALKSWYAEPGDRLEQPVDGFIVDICRGELLIEIQTRNLASIKRKLAALTARHPVRLVYPIPQEKWVVRLAPDGLTVLSRRKSPKRGRPIQLFEELVSCPELAAHPNFALEVLLTREAEIRREVVGLRRSRRGWLRYDRELLGVLSRLTFADPTDYHVFLPCGLADPFTARDLARALDEPCYLAQKVMYCLRKMGAVAVVGKKGNSILYSPLRPARSRGQGARSRATLLMASA
jgi:hypothetical protein